MSSLLTHEQIEDLLINVLNCDQVKPWKGDKISCCCPVHGESHPSFGINANFMPEGSNEALQVFNCFSCSASGTMPTLLMKAQPERFKSYGFAMKFLKDRYGLEFHSTEKRRVKYPHIKRYGEKDDSAESKRVVQSRYSLAVYKSGKETYKYFFNRGFTKEDMKEYMIGRDLQNKTVTIPVYYEDGELAGVIGRYISKNRAHNERYKIYNFEKSKVLYPLDKYEVVDDTIIVVESQFDCLMMRKWGIKNVLATMGGTISKTQAEFLVSHCNKVALMFDNDAGGMKATEKAVKLLKGKVRILPFIYPPVSCGKDPSEWGEEETLKCVRSIGKISIRRI